MKKLFLTCAFMCAFGTLSVFAQQTGGTTIVRETFKGEKARDSKKNPCKGDTDDVCYEKVTEIRSANQVAYDGDPVFGTAKQTVAKTVLRRPDGEIIDEYEEVYDADVNTVKQQILNNAFMNCGEVEVE